ncbi:MAG: hypothetical protein ACLT8C_01605 [Akkermansia muciniphila]
MSEFKVIRSPMEALKKYFGFSGEEGQDQVVASIMEGRNVLVVMPTGGESCVTSFPPCAGLGFAWLSVL